MVWSEHPEHKVEWYDMTPEELVETEFQYIGLLMEIVATKDIAPGEEVFLDYGDEWDAAWDFHVEEFNKKLGDEIPNPWPIRGLDLNEEYREKPYKTVEEQANEPYPSDTRQMCFLTLDTNTESTIRSWVAPEKTSPYTTDNLFDCRVMKRIQAEDKLYNYTVEWTSDDDEVTTIENVPHKAITFIDAAGKSDQFFQGAFRHYIGIPDDIFPQGSWRDLA
uniref:SET domain-containing protein n=1 Tax=Cyclophora tenuis TaxID=216820 RepID=A0A7S1D0D5_CYCTE|mmetsp:Transcript_17178/g.29139  ORF Transcript_17178/g.29139 Transcript_17178/m.29139 type:complete len:220 (+) Transcript_17178:1-660(+)